MKKREKRKNLKKLLWLIRSYSLKLLQIVIFHIYIKIIYLLELTYKNISIYNSNFFYSIVIIN